MKPSLKLTLWFGAFALVSGVFATLAISCDRTFINQQIKTTKLPGQKKQSAYNTSPEGGLHLFFVAGSAFTY